MNPMLRDCLTFTAAFLLITAGAPPIRALPPTGGLTERQSSHCVPMTATRLDALRQGFVPSPIQETNALVRFTLRQTGVTAYFTPSGFLLWNGQTTTVQRDGLLTQVPVVPRWQLIDAERVHPVGGGALAHTISDFRGADPAKWRSGVPTFRELSYPGIRPGVEMRITSRDHGIEYSFHVEPHARPDLRFRYEGITSLEKSPDGGLIVRTETSHFTESPPLAFQWLDGECREVPSWFEVSSPREYRIALGDYDERHELIIDPVLDWSTFLGATYLDELRDLKAAPDGSICVVGQTTSTDLPDTAPFTSGPGVNNAAGIWYTDVLVARLDPSGTELLWLGYLGGAGATTDAPGNNGLALDGEGNLYVSGYTESPDFPRSLGLPHAGAFDAFVTKIASDGSAILWSSFLGGNAVDWGWGITLDSHGPEPDVLVAGFSLSPNFPVGPFPTARGGARDAFVAKLEAATGLVQWSRYLGGSGDADRAAAVVANAAGEIFVFGDTDSPNFANAGDVTLGGANDAFLTKLDANGTVLWTTLVGGAGLENDELNPYSPTAFSRGNVALDSLGNVLVAGETLSSDFPVTPGAFDTALGGNADGFVAKISADDAHLIWATFLGGTGGGQFQDRIWGLAVNPWDEIFVSGRTDSPSFPVTAGALQSTSQGGLQDGFLAKLSANGAQLLYSTYLGGSQGRDSAIGVAYDSDRVLVAGWAASAGFPRTAGGYQEGCASCALNGWDDGFVMSFLDAYLAQDGFESGNYSGGTGWAGAGIASGDSSIQTLSGPHSGSRHLRLRSGTGYFERTAAIPPGASTLRLGLWVKVDSFEGSDQALLLAKTTGSFATLATFTPAQSDSRYHFYEFDLTGLLPASQVTLALDAAMNASNDNWFVDDLRLTATQGPTPPVADAGPDQSVTDVDNTGAEIVTLSAAASWDPDGGGIVAWEWKEGATVLGTSLSISPNLAVGVHAITLTVTDDEGSTATDTVQVTVHPYPTPVQVFYDSFEVAEWNGLWTEDAQNDWFRSTQRSTQGTFSAEVDGDATDASLTSFAIDLQGRTNATITFDWLIESGLDTGEYLEFRVSTNGGSAWIQKAILRGNVDPENSWRAVTVELAGITQLKLQFRARMNLADEDANVDNVKVIAH